MTSGKVVPIDYPNGVRYNLFEPSTDDPDFLWMYTAFDLAIVVRSSVPNRELGFADMYIGAGEWALAMEEILATIEQDPKPWDLKIQAVADRARQLLDDFANAQKE